MLLFRTVGICSFCLFCLLACKTSPELAAPAQLKRIPIVSELDQKERDFFLYLPKGYTNETTKDFPVLLFLHGNGERGDGKADLDYVMIHGPLYEAWIQKRDLPFIIIAPQLPFFGRDTMGLGYIDNRNESWIPQRLENGVPLRNPLHRPDEQMTGTLQADTFPNGIITLPMGWEQVEMDLLNILDWVHDNYRTDKNRVYLSGLSYGGFGTWGFASRHPELFAAINPIVGWGHPSLMQPIAEYQIPVWAFCGGRDKVIEARYFYQGMNKLEELGHDNIRFTTHEDMGHLTWVRVYAGEDIYNWLLEQRREE